MSGKPHSLSGLRAFGRLLAATLLIASAAGAREYRESPGVQMITPEEVLTNLMVGSGPIVVDARGTRYFVTGHIPSALDMSSKDIYGWVPDLEKFEDRGIVFYCDNGINSQRAAKKLLKEGFRKVFVMQGYLGRWRGLGYPLERGASK